LLSRVSKARSYSMETAEPAMMPDLAILSSACVTF